MAENEIYNPDACYELKVCRPFYFLRNTERIVLFVLSLFCGGHIARILISGESDGTKTIMLICAVYLVVLLAWMFCYPSKIKVMPESICVKHKPMYLGLLIKRRVVIGGNDSHDYNVRVYDIEKIEILQSSFEKLFNVGRIKFHGVVAGGMKNKSTAKRDTYTLWGLRNFSYSAGFIEKHLRIK